MTKKNKQHKKEDRVPVFANREDEARFWDTHSFADYWDEFKPVQVHFAKKLSDGITVRLDSDTLKKVRTLARDKGIGPTTLIRMWVLENLKKSRHAKAA
jgi:predicted DNA binding CopG/RHH family protein